MDDEKFWFLSHGSTAYPLYLSLRETLETFGPVSLKIQKTQIGFYNQHLFACVSMPRLKSQARTGLLLTFGLPYPLSDPRIIEQVEPYPGRWTHHVLLYFREELNTNIHDWLQEAYAFGNRP